MLRCPTSEFPIWPSGRPTAAPEASSVVHGMSRKRASKRGVSAVAIAFHCFSLRQPNPSRTTRMRKGRGAMRRENIRLRARLLIALEHHADVVRRAGLEVDGRDADELPSFVAEAIQLFGAARIHRV